MKQRTCGSSEVDCCVGNPFEAEVVEEVDCSLEQVRCYDEDDADEEEEEACGNCAEDSFPVSSWDSSIGFGQFFHLRCCILCNSI